MEENEIMVTEAEPVDVDVEICETESSGNGLKTVGALALTAAIGTGLFFGVKKLVKKIKEKKEEKYIASHPVDDDSESDDEE